MLPELCDEVKHDITSTDEYADCDHESNSNQELNQGEACLLFHSFPMRKVQQTFPDRFPPAQRDCTASDLRRRC